MSNKNRSLLVYSLVPAVLAVSVIAVLGAPEGRAQSVTPTNWSDPNTWPNRKVPVAGDKVIIARDRNVVLDVSPPALGGLSIDGKLSFSNAADLELTTEWIMLHGELAIGSEAAPHTRNATITFTDTVPGEDVMAGMGDRGIMISGGTLNLHGDRTHTWTKLAETAEAGSTSIEVLNAAEWRVGDEIVLASTDFDPRQAERRSITAIRGNTITLDQPLEFMHFGEITFDVDERGEVGLLTRNIKIQASADAAESFFGGHIMAMPSSKMFVEGVELQRMGQNLTLARYPIHWHLVGDAQGQYIRNAAIHDTFNRCVTVHGTNYLQVENNVTYNTVGHCFFLEDGIEHHNRFVRNLGIQTKCHTSLPCVPTNLAAQGEANPPNGQASKDVLIPSDNTVSTFWITNPDNSYVDNVAAGSDQIGFWMAFPEHPTGQFEGTEISANTWPRRTQIREFRGNIAHSNYDGLILDRGPSAQGTFNVGGNVHAAYADPATGNTNGATPIEAFIDDYTAYKNRNEGIWGRGEMHVFRNLKLADNAIGYTHAIAGLAVQGGAFTSKVLNSLFVGETDNVGNPRTPEEIAYGRSLPKILVPDFPIRGFEYYDFLHHIEDTTFVNYEDNDQREAGALSYLMFTSFGTSSDNSVERVKFIDAKPVHFPEMTPAWGNDQGGTGWRTAAIKDIDGSLGFGPNAYIVNDIGLLAAFDDCEVQPTWNAAVCEGDLGRMNVGGGGRGFGGGGFGGGRGAGAPRAGGPGPGAGAPGAAAGPGGPQAAAPQAGGPAPAAAGAPGAPGAAGPGGAPGAGAPGGRAGGFGGFGGGGAAQPPQPPVVLSRNGTEFTPTGETSVMAGTEIRVVTERQDLPISVSQLDSGSWVIFELPGFTAAASGTEQSSLQALRAASETSYFKGDDALWVKVVSAGAPAGGGVRGGFGGGGGSSISVSRPAPVVAAE
jgi:cell migration-inducing and hyaluronan-binding protein